MTEHLNYQFRWKNFRGFADTGWITIKPLTVLIGPNNSGKTSVTAPMLLLNQTLMAIDAIEPLLTRGSVIDMGGFADVIHNRDVKADLYLGIRFHTHSTPDKVKPLGSYPPGVLEITIGRGEAPNSCVLKEFKVSDIHNQVFLRRRRTRSGTYTVEGPLFKNFRKNERDSLRKSKPVNFLFNSTREMNSLLSSDHKDTYLRRKGFSKSYSLYLAAISTVYEQMGAILSQMGYIGPLRDRPHRYYQISTEAPRSVGVSGEKAPIMLRNNFKKLKRGLNKWIKLFEISKEIRPNDLSSELFEIKLKNDHQPREMSIADAGFGASQVLPLIVQALSAGRNTITIAEQPEIHLNPRLQCVLADLFVDMAKSNHNVIVETHSEHLLLRLRRLIASQSINPNNVALYFVEKKAGLSSVRLVPIQSNGHIKIDDWPVGFFGDTLKESLALATEQSRK